eukprot:m.92115 g.92115  ORF g.92115 m.92115 type:complete len:84 (+) comp26523_c0_seq1:1366-1617(+)
MMSFEAPRTTASDFGGNVSTSLRRLSAYSVAEIPVVNCNSPTSAECITALVEKKCLDGSVVRNAKPIFDFRAQRNIFGSVTFS